MSQLLQRAEADWLALRRPADEAARARSRPLLTPLRKYLSGAGGTGAPGPWIYDLGAGTGANLAWLAPRLNVPGRWLLLDRDPDLLEAATTADVGLHVAAVETRAASIEELPAIRARAAPPRGAPELVTCSAVLDILSIGQLTGLGAHLASRPAAALFSLNVTGDVQLYPGHALDPHVNAAFNAHQQRAGLAGPRALEVVSGPLRRGGGCLQVADTPWLLTPGALLRRYLRDRAAAVAEQDPLRAGEAEQWLSDRLAQDASGVLRARVGHRDLLALPAR